jgi:outer membrane immunogenic protein
MRRAIASLSVAVAAIGVTFSASAADLPAKPFYKASPPASAAYNWTGWYVGLNAGGNWGKSQPSTTTELAGAFASCASCLDVIASAGGHRFNTEGFTGGVFGGYNYQFGNFVIGTEVDFQYFRGVGSNVQTVASAACPCNITLSSSLSTDWLFTARPRFGFAANNWLFYGTGGLAVTKLKANWGYADDFAGGAGPGSESASGSSVKAGWALGGGIETALPNNWIIGAEYLYVDFGSVSTVSTNFAPASPGTVFNHSANLKSDIVRARASMRF